MSSLNEFMQVGMMLRGMGFDDTTSLYVASGKIYNSEKYMAPLRQMFPLLTAKGFVTTQNLQTPKIPNIINFLNKPMIGV